MEGRQGLRYPRYSPALLRAGDPPTQSECKGNTMKQLLAAGLFVAGLLISSSGMAQQYQCILVCYPSRVYCFPAGSPLPPVTDICKPWLTGSTSQPLQAPSESTAAPSACSAQPVFNEETQAYEWEMACD